MSYERLNLKNDDVLDETHLAHLEDGIEEAWETAALKLVASVTTTENSTGVEITGLNITAPTISIRIRNIGSSANSGLAITVNGIKKSGATGSLAGSGNYYTVRAWLYRDSGSLYGRAVMANSGGNGYEWAGFNEPITSIGITSAYENDGTTKYLQAGTIVDIYEGVYPNVQ